MEWERTLEQYDRYPRGEDTLILAEHIESAEFSLVDPQSKGIYSIIEQSFTDVDEDKPSTALTTAYNVTGTTPIILNSH